MDSLGTPFLRLGPNITSHSEICVFCHKMGFCWRFVILLLLLVISEFGIGVRRYSNEPQVARAVQMLEDRGTQSTVGERLGVGRSVVARLWMRFQETGRYRPRPGQRRGRATTARQDRYLRAWHVVIVGLWPELFRIISSRLQMSVIKQFTICCTKLI